MRVSCSTSSSANQLENGEAAGSSTVNGTENASPGRPRTAGTGRARPGQRDGCPNRGTRRAPLDLAARRSDGHRIDQSRTGQGGRRPGRRTDGPPRWSRRSNRRRRRGYRPSRRYSWAPTARRQRSRLAAQLKVGTTTSIEGQAESRLPSARAARSYEAQRPERGSGRSGPTERRGRWSRSAPRSLPTGRPQLEVPGQRSGARLDGDVRRRCGGRSRRSAPTPSRSTRRACSMNPPRVVTVHPPPWARTSSLGPPALNTSAGVPQQSASATAYPNGSERPGKARKAAWA